MPSAMMKTDLPPKGEPMAAARKKRVTITDIAELAGTSKTTVSFYLNGKTDRMAPATQERIRAAVEATGYVPNPLARGMNAKSSRLVGVVVNDIANAFSGRIVRGVERVCHEAGYRVLVSSSNDDVAEERAYIDRLLAVGVDGFIVQPTAQFREVSRTIEEAGKELVFFDSKFYDHGGSWVKTDNYDAVHAAVSSLAGAGYDRFLLVGAAPELLSSRIERTGGFVDALGAAGADHSSYTVPDSGVDVDDLTAWLEGNVDPARRTLVFAPNCWALPDVYVAMRPFYDLMPGSVGLLGFDNPDWAAVASPAVSCIEQPATEEGEAAARILLDLIDGTDAVPHQQVLPCSVVWRGTTLRPAG